MTDILEPLKELAHRWREDANCPVSKSAHKIDREVMEAIKTETRICARELESLIPAIEKAFEALGYRLGKAEGEIAALKAQFISGFYEDEYPFYSQGAPTHELQEVVTAEECNGLVEKLRAACESAHLERAAALKAAASILKEEMNLREKFDSHMRSIDELHDDILAGISASDRSALAAMLRKQSLRYAAEIDWWHRNWHRDTGIPCDGTMEVCKRAQKTVSGSVG